MQLPDLAPTGHDEAWSVCVLDAATGTELAAVDPERVVPTASLAKVFVLVELARRLEERSLDPATLLDRREVPPVHDSGLWQHLAVDRLPVVDVAVLVGATSDNWGTNVLLHHLGLERVQQAAALLVPAGSMLHDVVRDHRGAGDPATLSTGCARDWAGLLGRLHRGEVVSPGVGTRVLDWLATGTDLSMVAAAFGLDPLAHLDADLGLRLWNKTGTDTGVRAEAGLLTRGGAAVAYAVLGTWHDDGGPEGRTHVLSVMRETGQAVLEALETLAASVGHR